MTPAPGTDPVPCPSAPAPGAATAGCSAVALARLRLEIEGAVQGVGFRPHVFRLAEELGLTGWILNGTQGVCLEVEGPATGVEAFRDRLLAHPPPRAVLRDVRQQRLPAAGFAGFEIRHSDPGGSRTALVLPDLATCPACLEEVRTPGERRHRYPFANCTDCGPRLTILRALPYDRPNTTMAGFPLCAACRAEYEDPRDRRFHAQPIACPVCGPQLALWDAAGRPVSERDTALAGAVERLIAGEIVAVKGLGGFHLFADARSDPIVARLRERKHRWGKPFALMVRNLDEARAVVEVDAAAETALSGPEAPILLLPRRPGAAVAAGVAPGNPSLGVMLPATPLHHLLLATVPFPVVATSGNRSEEPICIDEREAVRRLGGIADAFLVHDRPIERHVDDAVAWQVRGRTRLLRRARGYAPLPVALAAPVPCILAVGAQQKNVIALSLGREVLLSQHIGDLETPQAEAAFERVIADFLRLYEAHPVAIAHDLHPAYTATRSAAAWAERLAAGGTRPALVGVQHHHAHLAACLAENGEPGPALGVTWDGTGFGSDGTVWGGEFLWGDAASFERVAHLRPFRLPGGEAAVREPRRVAWALLHELGDADLLEDTGLPPVAALEPGERRVLRTMLERGVRAPVTTSMGRLFDGVAALTGLVPRARFEGEAAMALEWAVEGGTAAVVAAEPYPLPLVAAAGASGAAVLDWRPLLAAVVADVRARVPRPAIAARFHAALVAAARAVAQEHGATTVALSGGCFQNRLLAEAVAAGLEADGRRVLEHAHVPPNDGGIALGQVAVAAARLCGGS